MLGNQMSTRKAEIRAEMKALHCRRGRLSLLAMVLGLLALSAASAIATLASL